MPTMTIEGLIAVIILAVTCFGLGYTIGSNNKAKNNRQSCKDCGYFLNNILPGKPSIGSTFVTFNIAYPESFVKSK